MKVAYVLYKLAKGCNIFIYSELFTIDRSNVSFIVKEVRSQWSIVVSKKLVSWPIGFRMEFIMFGFKTLCDLPSIHGAIDGTHISISKPLKHFSENCTIIMKLDDIMQFVKLYMTKKTSFDLFIKRSRMWSSLFTRR